MAKKILFSFEVTPGMVIAEDLYNPSGQLVLTAGSVLNDAIISKLESYTILEVPIDDSPSAAVLAAAKAKEEADAAANNSYADKLRKSKEFQQFKHDYETSTKRLTNVLTDSINSGNPIDTETIFNDTISLINKSKNTIHIFDIIHNLRNYDDITSSHSLNVALISTILGKWLDLSDEDLKVLTLAGLLHDIGKLQIPKDILTKPGKLTDEEFELMRSHVKKGYEILRTQTLDIRIKEACLLHHERCDGTGYPFGAVSSRITPFAKIVAIADVYDAMTASRSYRGALCPFDVIQMFDEGGLSKYDPHYLMTFLNRISNTYLNNKVRLSDGREGEIVMINPMCLYKPMVKVGEDFVNLLECPNLKIEALV